MLVFSLCSMVSLYELDNNSRKFMRDLFDDNINSDDIIISWKNKMVQKTDFFIKCRNYIKNISLKCGNNNSVHHEQIQEFIRYLGKIGISFTIIENYVGYHYGYLKDENGKNDYTKKISSEEYKSLYQCDIDEFNKAINKTRIIIDMIDRFIIRGRNSDYDIDALVCGLTDNYVWIKKYDLYDLILSKRCLDYSSPHIACLTIGPKKRNLDGLSKNVKDRYLVCIRWNFIRESIIEYKKKLDK